METVLSYRMRDEAVMLMQCSFRLVLFVYDGYSVLHPLMPPESGSRQPRINCRLECLVYSIYEGRPLSKSGQTQG